TGRQGFNCRCASINQQILITTIVSAATRLLTAPGILLNLLLPMGLQILKLISPKAAFKAGYCLATMMSTSFFNLTAARFLLILLIANGPFKDIAWLENGA